MTQRKWLETEDKSITRMWHSKRFSLGDICELLNRGEMDVRRRAFELRLGPRNPRPYNRQSTSTYSALALRPKHATAEVGTPDWCFQCDTAYVKAVRHVHPEREVSLRSEADA